MSSTPFSDGESPRRLSRRVAILLIEIFMSAGCLASSCRDKCVHSVIAILLTPLLAASAAAAEHVIQISIDGLGASYMPAVIDAGNAPNLKRFQTEGAWTNNARTDYTHTITLPNHTSMITGRPVSQPSGMPNTTQHGWTSNTTPPATTTLHNSGNLNVPYKASTFDVATDAGLSTAMYASKTKFILYEQSYNAGNGASGP